MESVVNWLLSKDQPALRYLTLRDLLDRPMKEGELQEAYAAIPRKGWAAKILRDQLPRFYNFEGYWHNYVLLNRPKYVATVWKFLVLIDLGLTAKNLRIMKTCRLLDKRYLSSQESYHLCMTANISRAFIKAGYDENSHLHRALDWLVSQQKEDGGWHCFESKTGTLDCWEPLSAFAALPRASWTRRIKKSAERGAEFFLERRLFKEGHRRYAPWFRFHYPVHYYYDVLVGLGVLASLGYGKDPRMNFALEFLKSKRRREGKWTLDAAHPDLGSEKQADYSSVPPYEPFPAIPFVLEKSGRPSKMITLRALQVLKQVET